MNAQQLNLEGVNEVSSSYRAISHTVRRSKVRLPKGYTADEILTIASDLIWEEISASKVAVTSPVIAREVLHDWIVRRYSKKDAEVFGVVFLNNQHQIITFRELFFGTINGAAVYPREVVKAALDAGSSAILVFHNHPAGTNCESEADRIITDRLVAALATVDIRVLDHLIVAGGETLSFAEKGLI